MTMVHVKDAVFDSSHLKPSVILGVLSCCMTYYTTLLTVNICDTSSKGRVVLLCPKTMV
jgi:hypothetical protein